MNSTRIVHRACIHGEPCLWWRVHRSWQFKCRTRSCLSHSIVTLHLPAVHTLRVAAKCGQSRPFICSRLMTRATRRSWPCFSFNSTQRAVWDSSQPQLGWMRHVRRANEPIGRRVGPIRSNPHYIFFRRERSRVSHKSQPSNIEVGNLFSGVNNVANSAYEKSGAGHLR